MKILSIIDTFDTLYKKVFQALRELVQEIEAIPQIVGFVLNEPIDDLYQCAKSVIRQTSQATPSWAYSRRHRHSEK